MSVRLGYLLKLPGENPFLIFFSFQNLTSVWLAAPFLQLSKPARGGQVLLMRHHSGHASIPALWLWPQRAQVLCS